MGEETCAGILDIISLFGRNTEITVLVSYSEGGSDSVELDTDSVRIRTYGLVLGGNSTSFQSFFNEFETTAVPEPTTVTVIVLLGVVVVARRRR